ncbi:MAG TPA: TonB dependent receptor, partial [Chitinophagaceae bacterium]|nr:TonB dependent receptor [Chitinophagaceae bacterium]
MRTLSIATLLFFLSAGSSYADIRGKIVNEQGAAIEGAALLLSDSSGKQVLKTALSDERGLFVLAVQQSGTYILNIKASGYTAATPQKLVYTTDLSLPDIRLTAAAKQLKEVSITNEKPLIEMKGGKVIVNVDQSISATGASVFDMIQRAPGVSTDNNDKLALKGKQGVQIMLDGKLMVVQGTELVNLLKSMPANTIEKIELMSNPGAQYDAAGTAGIINLKTKREKKMGYNGTAQLGAGQGVYPKGNGSLNMNYRKNKISLFLNGSSAQRKDFNKLDLDRIFIRDNDYNGSYKQDNYAVLRLQNYNLSTGLDYNLSTKTTIGTVLSYTRTSYTFGGGNNGKLFDSSKRYLSYFLSNNLQKNSGDNKSVNLNLRHTFDSTGRSFSFDADYAHFNTSNNQTQTTNYFFSDGLPEKPRYVMDGVLSGYTQIAALKSDYTHPIDARSKIETGLKFSRVVADNKPDFYDASGSSRIFDSSKSNHFVYHENISAAYITVNRDWKKWSLQSGLRYEHTLAKGDQLSGSGQSFKRDYGQLFPNIAGTYTPGAKHQFSLSLSRRIDRPNYEQLNPFKNYLDPTSIHQGNPYLNPSFSYTAELSHLFANRFSTSFSVSQTNDVITQVIILEDKITLVTDRNLARNRVYSLNGNYPLKPAKWWSSIASFSFYYSMYEGNLSNTPLRSGLPTAYLSSNNTFTLGKSWSAELNSWFSSEQRYGYMYLRPM